jgi:hypothetical protein
VDLRKYFGGGALGASRPGEKSRGTDTVKGLDFVIKDWFQGAENRAMYGLLL